MSAKVLWKDYVETNSFENAQAKKQTINIELYIFSKSQQVDSSVKVNALSKLPNNKCQLPSSSHN